MRLLLSTVITLKVSYSLLAVSDLYNNRGEKAGPVVVYLMLQLNISADNTFHLLCLQNVSC